MFLPFIVFAEDFTVLDLMKRINKYLINPLLILVFTLALVYFLYGLVMYLRNGESATERGKGQSHMLYGILGMTIMFSVYAIIGLITNTFGITDSQINARTGEVHVPDLKTEFNISTGTGN